MFYPTSEYAQVDEYGQLIDSANFTENLYGQQLEQNSPTILYTNNTFDTQPQSQQQIQYRSVSVDNSQPLAKCSVLYLGTAISSQGQRGIDAIQEPLSHRYPVNGKEIVRGIEAWLAIYENGLQLQFAKDPSVVVFYPIRSLVYCASIRFATKTQTGADFPNGWRFVPLDSPAAARVENTRNPPLFAATFRRTRHLPVDECFCFVTKTKQAALALVQACFSAYQATSPEQDCSKVPLYFKVDDYGSKNKEIDHEIRIVPAPDRERTLDYQTNTEGPGFFYKTDRVLIDSWQLWEHHKHDSNRSSAGRLSSSNSSLSSCSSSSSCSSCRQASRRNRRRRLASIASIPAIQQQSNPSLSRSASQTAPINSGINASTATAPTQLNSSKAVDPYAPAPNLIRVERIKDVHSGQDVFIRWVTEQNSASNEDQTGFNPQQAYSTQPPLNPQKDYEPSYNDDLPESIERLALEDDYMRRSMAFDDRPISRSSNAELKIRRRRSKREQNKEFDMPSINYEIVEGFFEDRHGRKKPVKLDRTRTKTIRDYRYLTNDMAHSPTVGKEQHRSYQATPSYKNCTTQQPNMQMPFVSMPSRPMLPNYIPRGLPYFPQTGFNTAPIFPRANFINRLPRPNIPFWYRPNLQ